MDEVAPYLVVPEDRRWFARCRRAWDLGALERRGLAAPPGPVRPGWDTSPAIREALAVHYFPGMWTWDRAVVAPLVTAALQRAGATDLERAVVEGFVGWSAAVDDFTPIRVEGDVEAAVPDPVIADRDLGTDEGAPVRYRDRLPLAVLDADDRCWLVTRHAVEQWSDPDRLALDERALTAAWAWGTQELALPAVGVIHDEIRLDPVGLRRTAVPLAPGEVGRTAARLGRTVMAMLDPTGGVAPTPDWSHCRECPFREPCVVMNRGGDAEPLLASGFVPRTRPAPEEGRLGGGSWSVGRGARPPTFSSEPDR